jgi:hypothetical protein
MMTVIEIQSVKRELMWFVSAKRIRWGFNILNAVNVASFLRSALKVTLRSVRVPFCQGQRGVKGADLGP